MPKLKIGIVGCGAIGSSLVKYITRGFSSQASLVALYDIDRKKAELLALRSGLQANLVVGSLAKLIARSHLVIEAASAVSSGEIAKQALRHKRSVMVMSVGGLLGCIKQLKKLAIKYHQKVYIPTGAISGVDSLKAAAMGKIKKVELVTRKNPLAFKGVAYVAKKNIALERVKKDLVLFSGPAKQAVKYFPQNINVAAIVSLAGVGPLKTRVKIIASPSVKRNIHELHIESSSGSIVARAENVLHPDNPKTSFLAVLSALATLRQIVEPIKIGT